MGRRDGEGTCEHCGVTFEYYVIHNGFNNSAYAYCDTCGRTCFVNDRPAPESPIPFHHELPVTDEPRLPTCECGGHFRFGVGPRCPSCREPLSADRAAVWLEAQAAGTKSGWRWQRSWQGIYCIVINGRDLTLDWKNLARAV